MFQKDLEEELREAAARGLIKRPRRTYCEACFADFRTPLELLAHIKRKHPA